MYLLSVNTNPDVVRMWVLGISLGCLVFSVINQLAIHRLSLSIDKRLSASRQQSEDTMRSISSEYRGADRRKADRLYVGSDRRNSCIDG